MTIKEWAEKLTGREYGEELINKENEEAKADGVIIVFGASDDLIEFRGAIYDEGSAYEGVTVKITPELSIFSEERNADTFEYNSKEIALFKEVTAEWSPKELETSWLIKSDIPHETFDIMEGTLYCRGIVFHSDSLKVKK